MTIKLANFYPNTKPFDKGRLDVGGGHEIAYSQYGKEDGVPIVYLHGGPGAGRAPYMHRFFDPSFFHIVTYDQRGAGKSTPFGEIKNNNPDLLAEDHEKLREALHIPAWHVSGGSWGSTLGILNAEDYGTDTTLSLTLRGIFTMRASELDAYYNSMESCFPFPEELEILRNFLHREERADLIKSYYNRIASDNQGISAPAALVWSNFENATCHLHKESKEKLWHEVLHEMESIVSMARMETSFFVNHRFTPDDRLLRNIDKIRHIPTLVVQGRYDAVCPHATALELKKAFPEAHLIEVDAGHSAKEDNIRNELILAANRIRDFGSPVPR